MVRENENALRKLTVNPNKIDFSSNDYLGFSASDLIQKKAFSNSKLNIKNTNV